MPILEISQKPMTVSMPQVSNSLPQDQEGCWGQTLVRWGKPNSPVQQLMKIRMSCLYKNTLSAVISKPRTPVQ